MEAAALWISLVAALGTGAAAIIAWTARADALKAQENAEAAQGAAVDAWQRAAGALEKANDIQLKMSEDAISRDRLQTRTAIGEALRRWYTEHAIRLAMGRTPSISERKEKRDLGLRLSGAGEPGAASVAVALDVAMRDIKLGDVDSALKASVGVMEEVRSWIRDPEAYMESQKSSFDANGFQEDLDKVRRLFNEARQSDEH